MNYAKLWALAWEVLRWPFVQFRQWPAWKGTKASRAGKEIAYVVLGVPIAIAFAFRAIAWGSVLAVLLVYGIVGSAVVAVCGIGGVSDVRFGSSGGVIAARSFGRLCYGDLGPTVTTRGAAGTTPTRSPASGTTSER
jgi:hypothetical protein